MKDIFGKALLDYQSDNYTEDIITSTNISEDDVLPLPYLFRSFVDMPKIEQKALEMCRGSVLDVGCGAGCHSLWLQKNGLNPKAIDISEGAIEVCKQRGVKQAQLLSLLNETTSFDTILVLMNGTGIFKTLRDTPKFLNHLKSLLNPNGQILIDSSDIAYMYEDHDEGFRLNIKSDYYGELDYFISYKGVDEEPLKWLYLDFYTLQSQCRDHGLNCELVVEGEHYDYLAKLTLMKD